MVCAARLDLLGEALAAKRETSDQHILHGVSVRPRTAAGPEEWLNSGDQLLNRAIV